MCSCTDFLHLDPTNQIVGEKVRSLEKRFAVLVLNTYDNFQEKKIAVPRICLFLNELSVSLKENAPGFSLKTQELFMQASLYQIFVHLRQIGAWDFLNFYLLESLIEEFGDAELQAKISEYGKEVKLFKKNTKLINFLRVWSNREAAKSLPDCKPLIAKLNMEWPECTLEDIDKLEGQLASEFQLNRFIFRLSNASPGSVFLLWLIPKSAAELIKKDTKAKQPNFTNMNIQLLVVDDECLIFKVILFVAS